MAQVFISHSKDDNISQNFFDKLFRSVNHKAFWYSWEGPTPPHAETLIKAINNSASLFVVLSKSMEKPHTRSWIGYEVGIASALNKNVWVFEPENEFYNVPVPYVTGYFQFPKLLEKLKTYPFYNLVETAGTEINLLGKPQIRPGFIEFINLYNTRCSHKDCKASYYVEDKQKSITIKCPVCRRDHLIKYQSPNRE